MSERFPERFGTDGEVSEVDLDTEEVYVGGERLTEERAEQLAEEILARRAANLVPGRKSLSGGSTHSPRVSARLPQDLYDELAAKAERDGVSISIATREALEQYVKGA